MLSPASKAGLVGAVLTTLALAASSIASWEGKRNTPYRDPVGIETVCYGETAAPMRRYSDAECRAMLEQRAGEFMEGVRLRNPAIAAYPNQWAAHTSFAYNVGLVTYGKSSVASLFARGRQADACRFLGHYVYAGGKRLAGLERRRAAETTSPSILRRRGWSQASFAPGDKVKLEGMPSQDGSYLMRITRAFREDGTEIGIPAGTNN